MNSGVSRQHGEVQPHSRYLNRAKSMNILGNKRVLQIRTYNRKCTSDAGITILSATWLLARGTCCARALRTVRTSSWFDTTPRAAGTANARRLLTRITLRGGVRRQQRVSDARAGGESGPRRGPTPAGLLIPAAKVLRNCVQRQNCRERPPTPAACA